MMPAGSRNLILLVGLTSLACLTLVGQQLPEVILRPPMAIETVLAVADFQPKRPNPELSEAIKTFNQVLWEDLRYSSWFKMASKSFYPLKPIVEPHDVNYDDWKAPTINADFLVAGNFDVSEGSLVVEGYVFDIKKGTMAFGKRVRGGTDQARQIAHRLADDIVYNLTAGQSRGIATTKIAFASERGGAKEIFIMDYDGHNQLPLTQNRSLNKLPNWSADNTKIAFVSHRTGNPEIHIISVTDGSRVPFPLFKTMASSPAFSPDGQRIAFCLRNPATGFVDIYVSNVNGENRVNITNSRSLNTSPCWSPTGNQIAFVSDRSGTPQIYIVDADGANLRRVLAEKGHADSPDWSPDGQYIAFTWRPEKANNFDIYVLHLPTNKIYQLTSNSGNNENPSWAPDGRHLVFQSDRTGKYQIYTMFFDGSEQRQLTAVGVNTAPAWSKYYN